MGVQSADVCVRGDKPIGMVSEMVVLVTGLIGSGKSEVCRVLREKGFPVYDSDSRTKALYKGELAEEIKEKVGLDPTHLYQIFDSPEKLLELEKIVHPRVLDDFKKFVYNSGAKVVFFESAIAAEKSLFAKEFDKVLLVRADRDLRLSRNPKACVREDFQKEPDRFDYLIENNGSLEELKHKVDLILRQL